MKKTKIGVIGCGDVSLKLYFPHIQQLVEDNKAILTIVCDTMPQRAELAKEKFNAKIACTDYKEVLNSNDVDIVVNLTPAVYHAPMTLEAIKASKHVYCEKPLALKMEDADAIIEEAKKKKVVIVCAPTVVLSPVVKQVKEIISKGLIGKICFVRAHGSHGGAGKHAHYYDPSWYYSKEMGGGPLFDVGVYAIQELIYTLGPVKRVTAFSGIAIPEREIALVWDKSFGPAKKIKQKVDDNTLLLLDWGNACYGMVDSTHCLLASKGPNKEYYGSEGVINVNHWGGSFDNGLPAIEAFLEKKDLPARGWISPLPERVVEEPKRPWTGPNGVEHLIDCLNTGEKPLSPLEMARHMLEIILSAYKAAETGETQDIKTTF